jgi:hypothetical protein
MKKMTADQRKVVMRIIGLTANQFRDMDCACLRHDWLLAEDRAKREKCVLRIAKILFPELRKRK